MTEELKKCHFLQSASDAEDFQPKYESIEDLDVCSNTGPDSEQIVIPDDPKDGPQRVCLVKQGVLKEAATFISKDIPEQLEEFRPFSRASNIQSNDQFLDAQASTNNFEAYGKICRSEKSKPGIGYELFAEADEGDGEKNGILTNVCKSKLQLNTLRGINLTDDEITSLVKILEAGQNDFCIDVGMDGRKALAVRNDYSVEDIDGYFSNLILQSGLFSPKRAAEIAASLKKSFEKERIQKKLQESGEGAWWKGPLTAVAASSPLQLLNLLLFYKMYMMQRRQSGMDKEPILPQLRNMVQEVRSGKKYLVGPSIAKYTKELEKHFVKPRGHTVLIAENGVGKTTVYEAFSQAIVSGTHTDGAPINPKLKNAVMYEINVQNDILGKGGTQYVNVVQQLVGQLLDEATAESEGRDTSSFKDRIEQTEKRIAKEVRGRWLKIVREARQTAKMRGVPVILFIDELHTIFKLSKTAQGGASAEEAFKARMARDWGVHIGGASTKAEWDEASKDNPALRGRLVPIDMPVPTPQEALELFQEIRGQLKERYGRDVSEEALREVVRLSEKATHTNFPRKGWDLLDYVAADLDSAKSQSSIITAEHVQTAFRNMHMGNLNRELTDAIRSAAEPRLSEAKIIAIERESIEKTLRERIRAFDSLPDDMRGRVMETLRITWRNMKPEFKIFLTPEGTPKYVIPDPFFDLTIQKVAAANQLSVIPEGERGGGSTGSGGRRGPGGTGGSPPPAGPAGGSGGTPVAGSPGSSPGHLGGVEGGVAFMMGLKDRIEAELGGRPITEEAIRVAVTLTAHNHQEPLPGKAMPLFETAHQIMKGIGSPSDQPITVKEILSVHTTATFAFLKETMDRVLDTQLINPQAQWPEAFQQIRGLANKLFTDVDERSLRTMAVRVCKHWELFKNNPDALRWIPPPKDLPASHISKMFLYHGVLQTGIEAGLTLRPEARSFRMRYGSYTYEGSIEEIVAYFNTPPADSARGKGGPGPKQNGGGGGPTAAGPAGEGQAARPTGGSSSGDGQTNRTRLAETKAPRGRGVFEHARSFAGKIWGDIPGWAKMAWAFAALRVAAHEDVGAITPETHDRAGLGILAGMTAANPYVPLYLAIIEPVFSSFEHAIEAGLDATGIQALKKGSVASTALKVVGGFAGTEAVVTALGRDTARVVGMQKPSIVEAHKLGWQTIDQASRLAVQKVRSGVAGVRSSVAAQAQNAQIGLRMAGQQAAGVARQMVAGGASMLRQAGQQAVQVGRQVVQTARQTVPAGPMMIAPAVAVLKGGAVVTAVEFAGAAAVVAGGVAAMTGGAVGAAIHYSGLGETIGTDQTGEWLGDKLYAWLH